ncbi:hypothetical protein INT45_009414 [Circinella minor]|uniref:Uncharacterized protein n=1 Tax=Circinella minor TaxID=1195481 RepID=A0A8H7RTZ9_9FUNG|nr:hypothetical protein INT45_009414 [Circinella minor]
MSNIDTRSYLCFCPLCQQHNPRRGFLVSGRTYRAHQNAVIINEAITGAPSVESDDGDTGMDIDNNYYGDVSNNNFPDYDDGYDEDYNDEGEYTDGKLTFVAGINTGFFKRS